MNSGLWVTDWGTLVVVVHSVQLSQSCPVAHGLANADKRSGLWQWSFQKAEIFNFNHWPEREALLDPVA